MTVEVTFGAGGDLANFAAINTYLQTVDPLTDDYTFIQVGDSVDNVDSNSSVLYNNKTVKIICPWNNSHQGDPTKGYVCEVTLAGGLDSIGLARMGDGGGVNHNNILELENLSIYKGNGVNNEVFELGTNRAPGGMAIKLSNLIFIGSGNGTAIDCIRHEDYWEVENVKFGNFGRAINWTLTYSDVYVWLMENVSIDNCTIGIDLSTTPNTFRNVVCTNCATAGFRGGYNGKTFINCADDDGSLQTTGGNIINCVSNIIPSDEYESTDHTSDKWLNLIKGTASLNGNASPIRGKAPLEVDFNASVLFQGYAPNLGQGGIASTLQDTDISGYGRPGVDDRYSIGAHEQQYSNFPES